MEKAKKNNFHNRNTLSLNRIESRKGNDELKISPIDSKALPPHRHPFDYFVALESIGNRHPFWPSILDEFLEIDEI